MRNQVFLKMQAKKPRYPLFTGIALILFVSFAAGCGGSKSTNSTIASVKISSSSLSMVAGEVVGLSASAVDSANANITTTFTFNSSNTQIATVSPAGNVCAGVWDSGFVVCNGSDAQGNPISGTAIITATAGGVTSGPVTVAVHPSITAVTIEPVTEPCFSNAQTHQFVAHAFHNTTEITNQIGSFNWSASSPTVASVDANGLATAHAPGITAVIAGVGATTSPAVFLKSCMPVLIVLHVNGDPAGVPTESAIMNVSDTKILQADMFDELGAVTPNAPVTILSNNSTVASMSGTTLTAVSPGGAGIQAVCAPPTCGIGINTPIYSNLFGIFVAGTSPNTTTVYAASTFPTVPGSSIPLIPIDASKTPPVAGTTIFLPGFPNSLLFDRSGATGYIGTNNGLVTLDTSSNAVTLISPVPIGKVLAVSADGNQVIISNAANDPSTGQPIDQFPSEQRVWVFDKAANTITTFVVPGAVAANFDDDGFRAYIVANNGNVYVFSPFLRLQTLAIGGASTDVTQLASGPFVYVANSAGLQAIATCNNAIQSTTPPTPPTNSTNIQFVQSVRDINVVVAVDSPGVDIENVNTADLTPPLTITPANCPGIVTYNNNFIDFGIGAFTARQLLVGSAGTHIAVLPTSLNKVLTVVNTNNVNSAGSVTLPAGATEALNGSLTPDGATLWVGVAGTNTVDRINLNTNADEVQIPMTFKKADGSPAPPNLVVIKPK
jgi:trimeric autotransporter adhesin